MENIEEESVNTQTEVEPEKTPEEVETSQKTQKETELSLTKEQKSKLDSFDRLYKENKDYKQKYGSLNQPEKAEKKTSENNAEEWVAPNDPLEIVKLGKVLKDYTEEETEFVIRNAKTKDINGIVEASKDPMVQVAITAMREKVAKENAVPAPSSPNSTIPDFDAEKSVKEGSELAEVEKRYKKLESGSRSEGL